MQTLTIIRPDDWHCHLRADTHLQRTVSDAAARFQRVIVMPNLAPPITTVAKAQAYRDEILTHMPTDKHFEPLMTLYLTDKLTHEEIDRAKRSGIITACKLYPAGATTQSEAGVRDIEKIYPLFETLQAVDMPLLIHGEVVDPKADVFDYEKLFIERELKPLLKTFPKLRVVLEHISTEHAVNFIQNGPSTLAATITPHHLLLNRNDLLSHRLRPHYYCLPIIKSHKDQRALIAAATSGSGKFFLGTDSAPHVSTDKASSCCPAGIYNTPVALEIVTTIFERENALEKLENFTSRFGAEFYQLPINTDKITLQKQDWQVPNTLPYGGEAVVPLLAGETIAWQCV